MAKSPVIIGLRRKEEEIKKRITLLKREIQASQGELEAVRKTLRISLRTIGASSRARALQNSAAG